MSIVEYFIIKVTKRGIVLQLLPIKSASSINNISIKLKSN